ncbi:MAG: prolipoprotein diacylglyceryl transferase family protein [Chloroflexota bacterium]
MVAALTVSFDPVLVLSDSASVRLETIGLAIVLFIALLLAARAASTSVADGLRLDDLVFMIVGAVPGAIIGGRLGYVLDHLDYYRANPGAMLDPGQGTLTLTLAVPLGLLTGSIIGRLLRAPIAGWMEALTPTLLFALAAGKLMGVLGASGQGMPTDVPWATAYTGPGPWGSLAADLPSHPSQVYEAILVGVVVVIVAVLARTRFMARGDGAILFVALGLWTAARFVAGFTWRDPEMFGPLRVEQLLLLAVALVGVVGLALLLRARRRTPADTEAHPA